MISINLPVTDRSPMSHHKGDIPLSIPEDVWKPLVEIRLQLDSLSPGVPTPIEEALREVINHYKHCPRTQDEIEGFRKRARAWKDKTQGTG